MSRHRADASRGPAAEPAGPTGGRRREPPGGAAEIPLEKSLPGPSFTTEAEFAREREAVLFADWFCVGREETLAGPGDYLPADVAGESILIVRGAAQPGRSDGPGPGNNRQHFSGR